MRKAEGPILIDLRKHCAIGEDFWDGLVFESRRRQKSIATRNTGPSA